MKLWYENPAEDWNEALPIGCGNLGGMIFGQVQREIIQLNEDTLWSGGGGVDRHNPDARRYLDDIRGFIIKGEIEKAEELEKMAMFSTPANERVYQPLGDLYIDFLNHEKAEEYERQLDIEKAIAKVSYRIGDITYTRKFFASYKHKIIAVHISADKKESISFITNLDRGINIDYNKAIKPNGLEMGGESQGEKGIKFCAKLKVIPEGGNS